MGKSVSVYNMPDNMLYEFDKNKYVWTVKLPATRSGNYPSKEYVPFTEVYEKNGEMFNLVASGRLINNPYTVKEGEFDIFDYDNDTRYSFKQTKPLERASLDDMYQLRDCISRM